MKAKYLVGVSTIISGLLYVSAATDRPFSKDGVFYNLFTDINNLISTAVIGLLIGVTIMLFFWALVRGMLRAQGGQDVKHNKDVLFWGISILFVMVSIWGIINFLQDATLANYKDKEITLPRIPNAASPNTTPGTTPSPTPLGGSRAGGKLPKGSYCSLPSQCDTNYCAPQRVGLGICDENQNKSID